MLNRRRKLTDAKVLKIRERLAVGATNKSLAAEFGVSSTVISHIKLGKVWKHLPGAMLPHHPNAPRPWVSKLTDAQVLEVRKRLARGEKAVTLSAEYGVTASYLSSVKSGYRRAHVPGALQARAIQSSHAKTRRCSKCKLPKSAKAFKPITRTRAGRVWHGRSSWCCACFRTYMRAHSKKPTAKASAKAWVDRAKKVPTHREKILARHHRYNASAKGQARKSAHARAYNQDPTAKLAARLRAHGRRVRIGSARVTAEQWAAVLEAWGRRCAFCTRSDIQLTMDHVVALIRGGTHDVGNIVPACKPCNCRKNKCPLDVFLCRIGVDPQTWQTTWTAARALVDKLLHPIQDAREGGS